MPFLQTLFYNPHTCDILQQANGRLEFTMDQSDGTGDYLVTFYFKDKSQFSELPGSLTWSEMNKKIIFTATQAE